jgi:hypothetical protein
MRFLFLVIVCSTSLVSADSLSLLSQPPSLVQVEGFQKNADRFGKLVKHVQSFLYLAQEDLYVAAIKYGDKAIQDQVLGLTKPVSQVISVSLRSALGGAGLTNSDRPIFTFYNPITDFLLVCEWSYEGKLASIQCLSGNHLLGKDTFGPMHDFPEKKSLIDQAVLAYRRVQAKLYEYYPLMGDAVSTKKLPEVPQKTLEFTALHCMANSRWQIEQLTKNKMWEQRYNSFIETLKNQDEGVLKRMMNASSPQSAEQLLKVPKAFFSSLRVARFQPTSDQGAIYLSTNPAFPHLWYDIRVDKQGLFSVQDAYLMNTPASND